MFSKFLRNFLIKLWYNITEIRIMKYERMIAVFDVQINERGQITIPKELRTRLTLIQKIIF